MCQHCGKASHHTTRRTSNARNQPENEMLMMKRMTTQNPASQAALLTSPHISGSMRRSVAQNIGQTHGNRYLQRMLDIQRQPDTMLRPGSRGPEVENLQNMLVNAGASIEVDGIFGMNTRQAVVAFQRAAGLSPDGIVGPQTLGKLNAGGITIPAGGGNVSSPASKLVMAKLHEINQMMKSLSKMSGQPAPKTANTPVTMTTPGEGMMPNHDAPDGEDQSWWDKAKEAAGGAADAAGGAWDATKEAAGSAWDATKEATGNAWDKTKETAGEAWNAVEKTAEAAGTVMGGIVDDTKKKVGEVVQGVQQKVNQGIDKVVHGASELASDVGKSIDDFGNEMKQKFAGEIAAVQEFVNDVKHYLDHPEDALKKLDEILNGLKKKASELFGEEPGNEEKKSLSGTLPTVEAKLDQIICHDAPAPAKPAPGMRRLKIKPTVDTGSQQTDTMPEHAQMNYDSIRPTLEYVPVTTQNDENIVQVPNDEFGSTGATIKIEKGKWNADHFDDFVTMNAKVIHQISYAITTTATHTDVPSDLSSITEENWREAADDLDPDVHSTVLGAPKRSKYWAKDITTEHEQYHVKDGDDYVRDKVVPALLAEISSRSIDVPYWIWRDTNIQEQLHKLTEEMVLKARTMRNTYMAKPGVESRTYAVDAAKYRARAAAIRQKAKDNGWK